MTFDELGIQIGEKGVYDQFATFDAVQYAVLVDGVFVELTSGTSATVTGLTPGQRAEITVLAMSQSTPGTVQLDVELQTVSAAVAVTPPGPPTPPTPPNPGAKKKQTVSAGAIPTRVKSRGTTVLNKRKAKTRQGRPLTAKVSNIRVRGEVACLRVTRGKQRKLTVRSYGRCSYTMRVVYTAPGNSKLRPFKQVRTFRVKR